MTQIGGAKIIYPKISYQLTGSFLKYIMNWAVFVKNNNMRMLLRQHC